jgi:Zn-dependent protease with chaperone function
MKRSFLVRSLAFSLALFFFAWESFAATAGPVLPDPGNTGVSKAEQEKLGRQAMAEVYKQMPVLPDSSPETQYVRQLGQKLVSVIPPQYSWPYEFHVIQQKEINAFALPGGPMFVNIGTILAAQNEAQLAGVMAHEMSHVYMQHSVKQMKKNTVPSLLAGLGQIAGQMIGGVGGALASIGGQVGGGMLSMKYSRVDEAQADAVGAIILYKAGYNPKAMADFFQQLAQQGGNPPQLLSDHPNPGNREQAIDNEIAGWPPKNYQTNSAAFERAKLEAKSVKAYTSEEIAAGAKSGQWAHQNATTGATPKNLPVSQDTSSNGVPDQGGASISNVGLSQIKPSDRFKTLNQNGLSIAYPDNWQVFSDQNGAGLTIAPQPGYSNGNVAYGVVVNSGQDQNARTLENAVRNLVQSMQQSNPDIRAIGDPQPITVNGVRGRSIDLQGTSPITRNGQSERERDWLVMLPDKSRDYGFIYFIFVAPENDFGDLRPTYERMLRSAKL